MLRICVDMDEVMADTLTEHLRRYNALFQDPIQDQIKIADLWGKGLWDVVSIDRQQALRDMLHSEDFFEDLPVMPDAPEVLRELTTRFEVFVATQAMSVPSSFASKYRWLQRYFPFLPPTHYVYCGDKSILRADYLIDDLPRNLSRFHGTGILFSAPHNLAANGFLRLANWREIQAYFAQI